MKFEPSDDQIAILDAVARLVEPYRSLDSKTVVQRTVYASKLELALRDGGFFDMGADSTDTRVASALIVAELAKLPVCIEATASLLVRPMVCPEARGPIALLSGDGTLPTRFLPQAHAALLADDRRIRIIDLNPGDTEELPSLFAYPVGRIKPQALSRARDIPGVPAELLRQWWRVGIALEAYGALCAANALTIEHVKQRRQFGQPLGAFQAIQHRLAMDATTIEAIRWLAMRAAYSGTTADAAMAAGYAQESIANVVYDLHQFSGAMGLTLEYPLHLFTYRARMLQSECGGADAQLAVSVNEAWPEPRDAVACSA
jgi:hypothetical protein